MPVNAGQLRHRVRIERRMPQTNSNGDAVQDPLTGEIPYVWTTIAKRWARVRPISGREFVQSQADQSKVTTHITIRDGLGITHHDRAVHVRKGESVIYDIHAVLPDADSGLEYVTLMASRGVNQG